MQQVSTARKTSSFATLSALAIAIASAASCATAAKSDDGNGFGGSGSGSGGAISTSGSGGFIGSGNGGGSGHVGTANDCNGGKGVAVASCSPNCTAWQSQGGPDINVDAPTNAASLFSQPGSPGSGPCLREPTLGPNGTGSMFPRNWLTPRFEIANPDSSHVYEITLTSPDEEGALHVYLSGGNADAGGTSVAQWTMDPKMWEQLAADDSAMKITVTVSSVPTGGGTPVIGSQGDIEMAPANANGAMIYWSTSGYDNSATSTELQGFQVGDDNTATVLTSSQVRQPVRAVPLKSDGTTGDLQVTPLVPVWCIGCHTATPDGLNVAFTAQWPWPNAVANVAPSAGNVGDTPSWMTNGAEWNLSPDVGNGQYTTWYAPPAVSQVQLGISTFSPAHFATGDRKLITSIGAAWDSTADLSDPGAATGVVTQLIWVDLETATGDTSMTGLPMAPCGPNPPTSNVGKQTAYQACQPVPASNGAWGTIARTGDSNSAGAPAWSHDGNTVAYCSTDHGTKDGRMNTGSSDIFTVPYNDGKGGTASPVNGAASSSKNEYYPAFSPDDEFIAFDVVGPNDIMYEQPNAEIWIVPSNGGTATRLASNDPPSCTGVKSPGAQNSWPKWAPAQDCSNVGDDGATYYWLTFSSTRRDTTDPAATKKQQLFISGVKVDSTGSLTTYPAVFLWNQDQSLNNMTPAWANFAINHAPPGTGVR